MIESKHYESADVGAHFGIETNSHEGTACFEMLRRIGCVHGTRSDGETVVGLIHAGRKELGVKFLEQSLQCSPYIARQIRDSGSKKREIFYEN